MSDHRPVWAVFSVTQDDDGSNETDSSSELMETFKPANMHDVNGDGVVNIQDLVYVASRIRQDVPADGDPADVNGDGVINIQDLVQVAGAIGN